MDEYFDDDEPKGPQTWRIRRWFVLHVKPRTEKKVFAALCVIGVFRYLPLLKKVKRVQRRRVTRYLPMFPGYVFTRLDPEQRRRVYDTGNVVYMIDVDKPRHMIHQLRQIGRANRRATAGVMPVTAFSRGQLVRVKRGPFAGIEGYVQRNANNTMLVLSIDIIGKAVEVQISPSDLEKADKKN